MTERFRFVAAAPASGLAALALIVVGCGSWPFRARAEQLREAADSLVPPAASVVVREEGDCVELAPSPSCVHIYFVAEPAPLPERVEAFEQVARRAGWSIRTKESLAGGTSFRLRRGRLKASIYLWRDDRAAPCRENPHKDCADAILVERAS